MKRCVKILIPLLKNEMKEVDNLTKPILKVIINSTVRSVLESFNEDIDSVDTVITRFLIRDDDE